MAVTLGDIARMGPGMKGKGHMMDPKDMPMNKNKKTKKKKK